MSLKSRFYYEAKITHVYDGDSITCDLDLGMGVWLHGQKIRLMNIDAPEVRGDERIEGLEARDHLRSLIYPRVVNDETVLLRTHKDRRGKYGRWLAEILVERDGVMVNLNDEMVKDGHATAAEY